MTDHTENHKPTPTPETAPAQAAPDAAQANTARPVLLERRENIAFITLNRPENRNTLTRALATELRSVISRVHDDPSLKAALITGAGADFSLGGSYDDFAEGMSRDTEESLAFSRDLAQLLEDIILGIVTAPIPFIAAINGQAAGAGMSLALACDLRIAEPRAKLNIAYGMLGASTDGGMSWFLPRYAGFSIAQELLYTQPILRAARAQELLLIHRVTDAGQLMEQAEETARQIAASATHSMRAAKKMLSTRHAKHLEEHMLAEHELFAHGVLTDDFRDAVHTMQRGDIPTFR